MIPDSDVLLAWKAVAVPLWIAAFFVLERLLPAATPRDVGQPIPSRFGEERLGPWRRVGRNLSLWLFNVGLSPLVVLPVTAAASTFALDWRPAAWSGWGGLLLDILLLDFLIYWWHRANHVVPFLWRFHEVHHLDRFLDTTSSLRFHFGEVLLSALARGAVVFFFGIPFTSVLLFETLVLLSAAFHHSNVKLPALLERMLALLVITPSIHWVHHHAVRRDTDSNYGTILSIWDPLFGSRSSAPRRLDMEIGVEGRAEEGVFSLILRPFRGRARETRSSTRAQ